MPTHTPRTFEVPSALVAAGFGPTVDLDTLDREVEFPGEFGEWAEKVLFRENTKILQDVCGDMRLLPRGILSSVQLDDGSLLLAGLVDSDGRVWDNQFNAWGKPADEVDVENQTVVLDDDEVAFVARAFQEGADEVWFRPYIPKAFISAVVAAPVPPAPADRTGHKSTIPATPPADQSVPSGSAIVAVVDPIDKNAVLEMLAITPGPHVLRRHDGHWFEDPAWVPVLKSVKPPKIVKLTDAQVASVSAQVDQSTDQQAWEPFNISSREQYQIFTASAARSPYLQKLQQESDEAALFALVAVAGRKVTPKDAVATERLKRYWTVGEGAAKIRWGTPGSWRRCYRHLVKYVGPTVAPGYCTNLGQRLGGHGVADHVGTNLKHKLKIPGSPLKVASAGSEPVDGDEIDPESITAANPSGSNGYSKGMTFEQATGGVQRDAFGKFSPESGSARSNRRNASTSNANGSWDESKAKFKLLPDPKIAKEAAAAARKAEAEKRKAEAEKKKIQQEQDRAKHAAQQEQLASLSLTISEASASGDHVKAAELRVQQAQLRLSFANSAIERINAETALNNARAALAQANKAHPAKKTSAADMNKALTDAEKKRIDDLLPKKPTIPGN